MNSLNAPGPPSGAMGQISGPQGNPGNTGFGPGLDPRFTQPGQSGLLPIASQILARVAPEQRAKMMAMPTDQLNLMLQKFTQTPGGQAAINFSGNPHQMGGPNPQPNANVPQEMRNMLMQQQQQQARARQLAALQANPQAKMAMDSMDFPRGIPAMLPSMPEGITKWGQLKSWLAQANEVSQDIKARLYHTQLQQFVTQRGGRGAPPNQQGGGRPQATPQELDQVPVTPADVQSARNSHPRFRDVPEAQLRRIVQQMKWQGAQNSGARPQLPQAVPQQPIPMATPQPSVPQAAPPPGVALGQPTSTAVSAPESQANARAAAPPNKSNRTPQPSKPAPQNPSTATQNKLKRPNHDDLEASSQPPASGPRPGSQAGQPITDHANSTDAQLAAKQRQQWQTAQMNRLFGKLIAEEKQNFDASVNQEVHYPTEQMQKMFMDRLVKCTQGIKALSQPVVLVKWFQSVRDEARLRAFFRLVSKQTPQDAIWLLSLN